MMKLETFYDDIDDNDGIRGGHLNKSEDFIMTSIISMSGVNDSKGKTDLIDKQGYDEILVNDYFKEGSYINNLHKSSAFVDYFTISEVLDGLTKSEKISNTSSVLYENEVGSVMSKLDTKNKYSDKYMNCVGVVCIGKNIKTGKNISFLSHHETSKNGLENMFLEDLEGMLNLIKENTIEGTIDIIILGGSDLEDFQEYSKGINDLDKSIKSTLGISASVVGGPTFLGNEILSEDTIIDDIGKSIYVDTENRRIVLFKRHNNSIDSNINFIARDISEIIGE